LENRALSTNTGRKELVKVKGNASMAAGRIKILHLITGLDTGGAEVSLQRLTEAMDCKRFENIVVSLTNPGPLSEAIRRQGIRVHAIHMSRSLPSPAAFWRLYRLLRAERPDVLQTWLYHSDLFGLLAGRVARVPAISWNIRCSNMGDEYRRGINGALVRLLARLSPYPDAVVANSQAGREEHAALGYRPKRWAVLENGFDGAVFKPHADAPSDLRRELKLAGDTVLIGLVARYDPIKDHEGFLRAAAELHSTDEKVHFVLVGDGIDNENTILNGLIDDLGIRDRIHLMGRREDIPRLTAGLDIATCCSLGEGFPNIVGEAMACAVPCVVTDVGDAARIVGDTGIVVPPADTQALAGGWRKLIAMGAAGRAELGQSALARVDSHYSLTRFVARYQDFYAALAHHPVR
jgi:glycosyltransferase involved in cell wall biosynthesis